MEHHKVRTSSPSLSPAAPHTLASAPWMQGDVEFVRAIEDHCVRDATLLSFRKGDVIRIVRSRNMHISKGEASQPAAATYCIPLLLLLLRVLLRDSRTHSVRPASRVQEASGTCCGSGAGADLAVTARLTSHCRCCRRRRRRRLSFSICVPSPSCSSGAAETLHSDDDVDS